MKYADFILVKCNKCSNSSSSHRLRRGNNYSSEFAYSWLGYWFAEVCVRQLFWVTKDYCQLCRSTATSQYEGLAIFLCKLDLMRGRKP